MFLKSMSSRAFLTGSVLAGSLAGLPDLLLAEEFDARSAVTAVTLYPQSATITREAAINLPAGQHEVTFADIPLGTDMQALVSTLQSKVTGATLGPVSYARRSPVNSTLYTSEAAQAAKAKVDELTRELRASERDVAAIRLAAEAAEDTLAYLGRLQSPDGATAEEIASMGTLIREQSLDARLAAADALAQAEESERGLRDLRDALSKAEAELARFRQEDLDSLQITLSLDVPKAADVKVSFSYMVPDAYWQPAYTARLDTETGDMSLTRGVQAMQDTGEAWTDVQLTFATDNPSRRSSPSEVYSDIRRISKPGPELMRGVGAADMAEYAAPVMEQAMSKTEAVANLSGLSLTYAYPEPATLYSEEGATEFALSEVDLAPDLVVRAVPLYDSTGYLMASFTNETGEMLVPGTVRLIRDGVSLGETRLDTVVAGDEVDLAFGAVDGVQVERRILSRNEGDRGMISKKTETSSEWLISLRNTTGRSWPVEVIDRVSVSEQEDLKIDWRANPMPDAEDYDGKRGVLAWHVELAAGAEQDINVEETLRWPEGMILR